MVVVTFAAAVAARVRVADWEGSSRTCARTSTLGAHWPWRARGCLCGRSRALGPPRPSDGRPQRERCPHLKSAPATWRGGGSARRCGGCTPWPAAAPTIGCSVSTCTTSSRPRPPHCAATHPRSSSPRCGSRWGSYWKCGGYYTSAD